MLPSLAADVVENAPPIFRSSGRKRRRIHGDKPTTESISCIPGDDSWEDGFEILDEIGAAFAGVDPDEIDREVAAALVEVRAEMRASCESPAMPDESMHT